MSEDMPPPEPLASAIAHRNDIIRDLHWMARRYADGRSTYAPSTVNRCTKEAISLGIDLKPPLYARDGMGRSFDGLTPDELRAAEDDMPRGHLEAVQQSEKRVSELTAERDAAMKLLAEIHNAFCRDTSGGHYAFFGGEMYARIKVVLGAIRPNVRDMNGPSSPA